jgi:hypothetical protein
MRLQPELTMNIRSSSELRVVLLFGTLGVLGAGITQILFLAGKGYIVLFAFVIPAALILFGTWAASAQGLLSLPTHHLLKRTCASGVLLLLVYPIGMLFFLATSLGIEIPQPSDFDEHASVPLTPIETFRNTIATPTGLFVGAVVILLICAVAVYVLAANWPRHVWSLVLTLPLLFMLMGFASPLDTFPLSIAFLGSQPLLCVIAGYWICEASQKAEVEV